MIYLVRNIQFNNNKEYTTNIPVQYMLPCLAQLYLRSHIFFNIDLSFDVEAVNSITSDVTRFTCDDTQWSADIVDTKYETTCEHSVLPLHASRCVVYIEQQDLEVCDGNLHQAVFEQLMQHLQVDFYYKQL